MTNYVGTDVIRLIGVNHPDEINSDNDYQKGRITEKLGNKVRISWIDRYRVKNDVSFEFTAKLHKLDRDTFWFNPDGPDNPPATVEAIETALSGDVDKALEMTKPARRRAAAK